MKITADPIEAFYVVSQCESGGMNFVLDDVGCRPASAAIEKTNVLQEEIWNRS